MNIKETITSILQEDPGLRYYFLNGLLNHKAVATHILPMIKAKSDKVYAVEYISSALGDLQEAAKMETVRINGLEQEFYINKCDVLDSLVSYTFDFSPDLFLKTIEVAKIIQMKNDKICLIQGVKEFSLIFDESNREIIESTMIAKPKSKNGDLAAVIISYNKELYSAPGIIHRITQCISFEGITIYEISNTFTELIIYVSQDKAAYVREMLLRFKKSHAPKNLDISDPE